MVIHTSSCSWIGLMLTVHMERGIGWLRGGGRAGKGHQHALQLTVLCCGSAVPIAGAPIHARAALSRVMHALLHRDLLLAAASCAASHAMMPSSPARARTHMKTQGRTRVLRGVRGGPSSGGEGGRARGKGGGRGD